MLIAPFTVDDLHEVVDALAAAVDAKDSYTCGHSERVAEISLAIAKELNLSDEEQYLIHIGAHLHDVGKIGIPDAVISKPGRLTNEEFKLIKDHPIIGYHIVSKVKILQSVSLIVRHHHERIDGGGYPDGLRGEDIPLGARIVAVADAFDAMTTNRTYKVSMSISDALQELTRCSDTQFDRQIVEVFVRMMKRDKLSFFQTA
ncbi:HD-GYP domain-containing protein [Pelosinus sp. sgz500959]|uniref:HD-GYP domain-containing protein n=1 Tax=Pelosinus sp. sgz500959 TaxID=3242472 RepID=UPI00366F0566